jgi:hypothetical protein
MKMQGRRSLFFLLPALLLAGALGQRALRPAASDREREEERLNATAQGRALLVAELRREIERDASERGRAYVRKHLLSPSIPDDAIKSLKLDHIQPHRYRVRATVEIPSGDDGTVTREVEADLQHGPLDKQWRLVDTEFLSASR